MSIRKRNEFLDDADSEDEIGNGSESETEEGRGAIANKRRKISFGSEASSGSDGRDDIEEEEGEDDVQSIVPKEKDTRFDFSNFDEVEAIEANGEEGDIFDLTTRPKKSKAQKEVEAAAKKARNSGVLYISRVPPFMKPQTLKHFLLPHATAKGLGRIFLTPEDHIQHTKRVRSGGNKKKSYTDGWVEFHSKKEAQVAAELLNGQLMGGKKGGFYHDDMWNIKYLKGFKWNDLTEQIKNEDAERAAKVREGVRITRRENKRFVEDVERGRMEAGKERKKKGKGGEEGDGSGRRNLLFKQRSVQGDGKEQMRKPADEATTTRALSKIF